MVDIDKSIQPCYYGFNKSNVVQKEIKAMLNDAAKKLVARAARVAAKENRSRAELGANVDQLASEAWRTVQAQNVDFSQWSSAKSYFETVFHNEIERD